MTRDAPASAVATAIPTATGTTLTLPAASVMAVSMTGAAIAAIRTMSDGESCAPESNGNQTRESSKA
jgi:hypothetical protein